MPIGATLGASIISGGASIIGANKAAKSSKDALAAQMAEREKVWGKVDPFLQAGGSALGRISDPSQVLSNFQASPDYNFRMQQGLNGVTTNRAVNGLLRSGSALKAVTGYASNLASGEFGNWWNRQSGLAGMGLQGAQIGAGLAAGNAGDIGRNANVQGDAAISNANTIGQFGGSIADLIGRYGGGGGGGGGSSSYTLPQVQPAGFGNPTTPTIPGF